MRKIQYTKLENDLYGEYTCSDCLENVPLRGYNDNNYMNTPILDKCICGKVVVYVFRFDYCEIYE